MSPDRDVDNTIAYAKIHPSIGIARVGDSRQNDGFYIGPQLVDPPAQAPGFYRDDTGALKREVAEFRIYGYNSAGQVVSELVPDEYTHIEWQVELANHKAAWYNFDLALDIPNAPSSTQRNAKVLDRKLLSVEPGARTISGTNTPPGSVLFDGGKFHHIDVSLGELRTDSRGRLQVFGGHGKSGSLDNQPPVTFANNDGWYDDTGDGPVTATLILNGQKVNVAPAWVVVAPPNYGPQQKSVRTLYALLTDVAIRAGQLSAPLKPSFRKDIFPILKSMCDLQWMNAGFAAGFGHGMPQHFLNADYLKRLSQPGDTFKELRRNVATSFRNPADGDISMKPWPWVYGDAMDVPMPEIKDAMNALTTTQLALLHQWADGNFIADFKEKLPDWKSIDEVPLEQQPTTLDRASLEFCLADAFHPGCEVTWPVRHATMYSEPYRIRHRDKNNPEPRYGRTITPGDATSYNGPLYAQFPGSITRWMAIPWQTDTASCRSGYNPQYDPYLPTFWPARVPNQVLSVEDYETVMSTHLSRKARLAAFNNRSDWDRTLGVGHMHQLAEMIDGFSKMGIVEVRPGIENDPDFPAQMQVEDRGGEDMTDEERYQTDRGMRLDARLHSPNQ